MSPGYKDEVGPINIEGHKVTILAFTSRLLWLKIVPPNSELHKELTNALNKMDPAFHWSAD